MKITTAILSIPPYLSTTWKNISSLHVREELGVFTLIVILQNRMQVEVPNLSKKNIDEIFEAHARSAEETLLPGTPYSSGQELFNLNLPSMQHNPEQAHLRPLPPDVLKKIALIARALGFEDPSTLAKAEPHCNCTYCQVARVLQGEEPLSEAAAEEVSEEDLRFRDWEIQQTGDKIYTVTSPETGEQYSVFLGTPLGCTCGSKNCEHIRLVLKN